MNVTITKCISEQITLTDDQVSQVAKAAILKKLGLSDNCRIKNGIIYDDFERTENMRIRVATDNDIAAFIVIDLL